MKPGAEVFRRTHETQEPSAEFTFSSQVQDLLDCKNPMYFYKRKRNGDSRGGNKRKKIPNKKQNEQKEREKESVEEQAEGRKNHKKLKQEQKEKAKLFRI